MDEVHAKPQPVEKETTAEREARRERARSLLFPEDEDVLPHEAYDKAQQARQKSAHHQQDTSAPQGVRPKDPFEAQGARPKDTYAAQGARPKVATGTAIPARQHVSKGKGRSILN